MAVGDKKTTREINKQTAAIKELTEALKPLIQLFDQLADNASKTTDATEAVKETLGQSAVAAGDIQANLTLAKAELEKLEDQAINANLSLKEQVEIVDDILQAKRAVNSAEIASLSLNKNLNKEDRDRLELLIQEEALSRRQLRATQQLGNETDKLADKLGLVDFKQNSVLFAIKDSLNMEKLRQTRKDDGYIAAVKNLATQINEMGVMQKANAVLKARINATNIFVTLLKASVDLSQDLYNQTVAINKATGMGGGFLDNMENIRSTSIALHGDLSVAANVIQAMVMDFSDFTGLSDDVQNSLLETGIQMEAIGVGASDFAKSMQILTKSMGHSTEDARLMNIEMVEFASSIGKAPSQMLADFATAMPKLAVYGQRAQEVFMGLERRSKATGLSIDTLIGVTERMDTFEGAAEAAMQLNSALGGAYFDSVQLMMADEEERLAIIKDTLKAQGLQFDQMGKFEKKMLAQAAGFSNVAEMAAFMNGEMGETGTQKSFNDMLSDSATIGNSLKAIFMELAVSFAPIIKYFAKFLHDLTKTKEATKEVAAAIYSFGSAIQSLTIVMTIVTKISKFLEALAEIGSSVQHVLSGTTKAAKTLSPIMNLVSLGAKIFSKFLVPLGVALTLFETFQDLMNDDSGAGWFVQTLKFIGQAIANYLINPFAELFNLIPGLDIPRINLFKKGDGILEKAAIGTSSSPGGMTIVGERGPEIMNVPRGSQISPASRTADIQTSIESLANAVSKLAAQNGGGNNRPIQVNLTVDGKKLAEAVFNNTSYSDFG